jgi:hypothetical protein
MVIRVEAGKGRKDRYVMLSPTLLAHQPWAVSVSLFKGMADHVTRHQLFIGPLRHSSG